MHGLGVCAECDSLLGDAINAVNAHAAELTTASATTGNGSYAQFAQLRKRVEEASNAVREAIELYQGHVREHLSSLAGLR